MRHLLGRFVLSAIAACGLGIGACVERPIVGHQGSVSSSTTASSVGSTTSQAGTSDGSSSGSSNGSSTGGATSSGGTTGPGSTGTSGGVVIDDGGCQLGEFEFFGPCDDQQPCPCGLSCVTDDQMPFPDTATYCEYPCTSTADCANPADVCRDGACRLALCGPIADGGGGPAWGACQVGDAGPGTCISPFGPLFVSVNPVIDSPQLFVCLAAGTATTTCDIAATRAQTSERCAAGQACNPLVTGLSGGAQGECGVGCTLSDPFTPCPAGSVCSGGTVQGQALSGGQGFCFPSGDGGCAMGLTEQSYAGCSSSEECGCPDLCVRDQGLAMKVCEPPCSSPADCLGQGTTCVDGFCASNFCVNGPGGEAGGQFDLPCTSITSDDSTCLPLSTFAAPSSTFGLCARGGQATGACSPPWQFVFFQPVGAVVAAADLCPARQICLNDVASGSSTCQVVCDPLAEGDAGSCSVGDVCLGVDASLPNLGICGVCRQAQDTCFRDPDCCAGSCVFAFGAISGECH